MHFGPDPMVSLSLRNRSNQKAIAFTRPGDVMGTARLPDDEGGGTLGLGLDWVVRSVSDPYVVEPLSTEANSPTRRNERVKSKSVTTMAPRSTSTSTSTTGAGCTWATIERVELWPVGEPFLGAVSLGCDANRHRFI